MSLWPLDGWSDQRAAFKGSRTSDDTRAVEREVEQVLGVMRTRPEWFEAYVERPLGTKVPPLAPAVPDGGIPSGPPPLALTDAHEILDAKLADLASLALTAIERRIAGGVDLMAAVAGVLGQVFGSNLEHELGELPHGPSTVDEHVTALVTDPAQLAHIVAVVQGIFAGSVVGSR
jgi:hypothetical protein